MSKQTLLAKKPLKKPLKGRPPQANADQYRDDFLACALEVFVEKGYAGSSIEGIARYAKVSKNTIYLQFRNKENLFQESARFALAAVNAELHASIDHSIPFESALLAIIQRIQTLAADANIRSLTRLLVAEAQRFPDIAAAMHTEFLTMMAPIADYLQQASIANDLSIGDTTAASFDLTILALGGFDFLLSEPETSQVLLTERALRLRDMLVKGWQG